MIRWEAGSFQLQLCYGSLAQVPWDRCDYCTLHTLWRKAAWADHSVRCLPSLHSLLLPPLLRIKQMKQQSEFKKQRMQD